MRYRKVRHPAALFPGERWQCRLMLRGRRKGIINCFLDRVEITRYKMDEEREGKCVSGDPGSGGRW